jgi:hypothetical protein
MALQGQDAAIRITASAAGTTEAAAAFMTRSDMRSGMDERTSQ